MRGFQLSTSGCFIVTVKYLKQRPSGLYFFRKGIPVDLREYYEGKRELVYSLQTKNEAEAVKRVQRLSKQYEDQFRQLRSTAERDKAVKELKKFGLEDAPLDRQTVFRNGSDPYEDGSPFSEMIEEYSMIADAGGYFDDTRLVPSQRRALQILKREEKFTLEDVKQRALVKVSGNKKKEGEIKRFFKYFHNGNLCGVIDDIRPRDVVDAVDALLSEGKKTTTIKKALGSVRKLFREFSLENDVRVDNPFNNIPIPGLGKDSKKRKACDYAEIKKLKEAIELNLDVVSAQISGLLFNTGCRCGEVSGLLLEDLHLDSDVPYVRIKDNDRRELKTKKSDRHVPLIGLSLEAAKAVKSKASENQIYAFPKYHRDGVFKNDNASAAVNGWLKNHVVGCTSHSFRHTLKDRMYEAGIPKPEIEDLQGWVSGKMVDYYGKSKGLRRLQKVLLKMEEYEGSNGLL
ncbi:tyrosine-type recombinase/integrase [Pontibacterium sp.]|uniref:tyrosine-type recombinase/integrase n=1 Tax=Pontibacterium sp. TaxID=2036026 RepID=UPI0035188A5E